MFNGIENTESLYYTKSINVPDNSGRILYRLQQCAEDTAFAVYCYVQDATYLRLFSAVAWREFTLGVIGIQTAAFCTDSVDATIGKVSEKLRKSFDSFEETWMTRMHTKLDAFLRRHCGDDATVLETHLDGIMFDCDDIALATHANRRLGYYASTIACVRTTRLMFENFLSGSARHPDINQEVMPFLKSVHQLRCLESMPGTFSMVLKRDCMYSAAHALVLGHLDSDAVLAAQMMHDIQKQVIPETSPLEDIVDSLSERFHQLYQLFRPVWSCEGAKATNPERFRRMSAQHELLCYAVGVDTSFQDEMDKLERMESKCYSVPDFGLLRHVPTLIGQLIGQYQFEFQNEFLELSNDYGDILTTLHFYNAAKNSGSLQTQNWKDMEWVIEHQPKDVVFAGDPPATNAEYARRFCLEYGLDVTQDQTSSDVYFKRGPPKRLESCSKLVRNLSDLWHAGGHADSHKRDRHVLAFVMALEQLHVDSPYGMPSNIGMLMAAKETHDRDEEARWFNIFEFHAICSNLLTVVRNMCLEEAPNDYPATTFGKGNDPNLFMAELLRDPAHCQRHHHRIWPKAVKVLSTYIGSKGSLCYDNAVNLMKEMVEAYLQKGSSVSGSDTARPTLPLSTHDSRALEDFVTAHLSVPQALGGFSFPPETTTQTPSQSTEFILSGIRRYISAMFEPGKLLNSLDTATDVVNFLAATYSRQVGPDGRPLVMRAEEKAGKVQDLIEDCRKGNLSMEIWDNEDNYSLLFSKDGRPKWVVELPYIAISEQR
ncbi:hypothetical protein E8E13_009885 [Curvularia kusanoi]|uniref:Uncharacterized protein n=1 Tax=Curvularia kusanoi TaxID=90978 RepID=A0A9P4TDP8_CURKU|nr:hypothetical protein E8E13_009885 [Curvularia kusanoi]